MTGFFVPCGYQPRGNPSIHATKVLQKILSSVITRLPGCNTMPARVLHHPGDTELACRRDEQMDVVGRGHLRAGLAAAGGHNTPFAGLELKGRVVHTLPGGRLVYSLTG